ncbi:hypothetical protein [Aureibacter tunicatorum]|uniref:Porin n=1 Tax=Aureibacter tunicatorum TaxID=866807 RepID=A0AAE4BPI7_9BACT|nr:hypothetical protein [Aureibacter tunicatorum]MDR6238029.1 hypothetical protein [Aureibacter tunicatorum]BDD03062.1 hypothetical protein AUTU_05450 [Aureibacter tunicatorum]
MKRILITLLAASLGSMPAMAQSESQESVKDKMFESLRPNDQTGLNVFEPKKLDNYEFDKVRVRVGGNFNMHFQGLTQENYYNRHAGEGNATPQYGLSELGQDFNLPMANFNLDVVFAPGVTMKLETYLSSRHHVEANVKGGYLQLDALPFLNSAFLDNLMKKTTIKAGLMEVNYGDAHFRRSDGGNSIYNPFVGNYLMDAFTTELALEILMQDEKSGLLGMIGVSNGKLNQSTAKIEGAAPSLYGKVGIDKQVNSDLRVRTTGSFYTSFGEAVNYLYTGDRAGSRYFNVTSFYDADGNVVTANDWSGRVRKGFNKFTSFQINQFVKYQGLEFFGTYEYSADGMDQMTGTDASGQTIVAEKGNYNQFVAELLYRFGEGEKFYVGGRYNTAFGNDGTLTTSEESGVSSKSEDFRVDRFNIGGGWFMTKNILTKIEYVNQHYKDGEALGPQFKDARFHGVNIEAVIAF